MSHSVSVFHICNPIADIAIAITPGECSFAMFLPVFEMAFVFIAIGPFFRRKTTGLLTKSLIHLGLGGHLVHRRCYVFTNVTASLTTCISSGGLDGPHAQRYSTDFPELVRGPHEVRTPGTRDDLTRDDWDLQLF